MKKINILIYWETKKKQTKFNIICDMIKGNESNIFNIEFLTPQSDNFKMLHSDVNHIIIRYLVTEFWAIYQYLKQYKTKEFDLFLCLYLKNDICDIWLIPLDHVTNCKMSRICIMTTKIGKKSLTNCSYNCHLTILTQI